MNFTQKELKTIATQRAEKSHRKALIISLLLTVNLLGLILLGLYVNGVYPPQPTESVYISDNNTIQVAGNMVTLNGQEAQIETITTHEAPIKLIAYPPLAVLIIGLLYYRMRTKKDADRIMYDWAREDKDGRE